MIDGRKDLQRVNGLRIEAELRRKDEETAAQHGRAEDFDNSPRPSRFRDFVGKIQRAVRR